MDLTLLGWDDFFSDAARAMERPDLAPGRVVVQHRGFYRVVSERGETLCQITGKMRHKANERPDYPAVGDWVLVELHSHSGVIREILPRKSKFSRRAAGEKREEQIVAANVDIVWIVTALDHDFNIRRVERYLTLARESGARPRIILSKLDMSPDPSADLELVNAIAGTVPITAVSVRTGEGIDELKKDLTGATTVALLGSSGVGKSTLINYLAGEELLRTNEVREKDSRGRHTTTHRELIRLPNGGIVIDTPGMREIQLWEIDEGLQETFEDLEAVAANCKFGDCRHENEPGCAVQAAIEDDSLDASRLTSFNQLRSEKEHFDIETDLRAKLAKKSSDKSLQRALRAHLKTKRS